MNWLQKHTTKYHKEEYHIEDCEDCPFMASAWAEGSVYYICKKETRVIDTDHNDKVIIPWWCPLPNEKTNYYLKCPACLGIGQEIDGFTGESHPCSACFGGRKILMETARMFLKRNLFQKPDSGPGWERAIDQSGLRGEGYYCSNVRRLRAGFQAAWPDKKHSDILVELEKETKGV